MSGIKRIAYLLLMLLGLILSVKLFDIYMNMNFNPNAMPSFCNINNYVDCDGVAKTTHARFLGLPLALWGIFLYLFFLFLTFVDKLKKIPLLRFLKVFKNPEAYIASVGVLSFIFSICLAFISVFEIEKICILCFVTYFINLFIALIARNKERGFLEDIKTSFKDFLDGIKKFSYFFALLVCLLVFATFLHIVNQMQLFVPALQPGDSALIGEQAKKSSIQEFAELKKNPYKISGNTLGDPKGKVIVNLYTDYYCPFCRVLNIMLYKATQELSDVLVLHHDFPLDENCNPLVKNSMHPNACMAARYVIAASKQEKAWDMDSLLFDNKPETEDELLKLAKKIKELDVEKLKIDANSSETQKELSDSIDRAIKLNIKATPTMLIGSTDYTGVVPYEELKALLIDLGATEKTGK